MSKKSNKVVIVSFHEEDMLPMQTILDSLKQLGLKSGNDIRQYTPHSSELDQDTYADFLLSQGYTERVPGKSKFFQHITFTGSRISLIAEYKKALKAEIKARKAEQYSQGLVGHQSRNLFFDWVIKIAKLIAIVSSFYFSVKYLERRAEEQFRRELDQLLLRQSRIHYVDTSLKLLYILSTILLILFINCIYLIHSSSQFIKAVFNGLFIETAIIIESFRKNGRQFAFAQSVQR